MLAAARTAGRPRTERAGAAPVVLVAALAWGAALIHLRAAADHAGESVLYTACFALLAVTQLGWGGLILRAPNRRRLVAGIVLSLAVAGVWLLSRTVGLPVGPDRAGPEGAGVLDVLATLDELMLAGLATAALRRSGARTSRLLQVAAILVLLTTSLAVAGGTHAH